MQQRSSSVPVLAAALLWTAAFSLSCLLSALPRVRSTPGEWAAAVFGSSREAIAGALYERADLYFHRGVGHVHEEAFARHPFQRLTETISPSRHVHVHGANIKEIMPWLWLALQSDPYNVDLYLVSAFWLWSEAERYDLALRVLRQGQARIPYNHALQTARGRLMLKQGRLTKAAEAFDAALAFWEHTADPDDEQARFDRAEILFYRALLHEADGENERAVGMLHEIVKLFPDRHTIADRARALAAGEPVDPPARALLQRLVRKHEQAGHACGRDAHGHEHEHEHGHGHDHEHEHEHEHAGA